MVHEVLAGIAIAITFYQYFPYVRSVFDGRTKPHLFSWLIWGLLSGIVFFGQVSDNAGVGALVTGFTAFACFIICVLCWRYGEKNISRTDWISFFAGLSTIPIWYFTKEPFIAVLLVTFIDLFAFYPTLRKSWEKPHEELLQTYVLTGIKFLLTLLALENLTPTSCLYPFYLVVRNSVFVALLLYRRKVLHRL